MDFSAVSKIKVSLPQHGECCLALFEGSPKKKSRDGSVEKKNPPLAQTAIVYGRNGAGKSSIAREVVNGVARLLNKDGVEKFFSEIDGDVHVFDEQYIENNFRQMDRGALAPIILLGDAVVNQVEIDAAEKELRSLDEERERSRQRLDDLDAQIERAYEEIRKTLRNKGASGLGSWALRSGQYHSQNQFMNVRQDLVARVIAQARSLSVADSGEVGELAEKFQSVVGKLQEARSGDRIEWSRPSVGLIADLKSIQEAADRCSPKGINSRNGSGDLEKKLQASSASQSELSERLSTLFSDKKTFCPCCFQDIDPEFKKVVREFILDYLNGLQSSREMEALKRMKISWSMDLVIPQNPLDRGEREAAIARHKEVQKLCETVNRRIDEKLENPNRQVDFSDMEISKTVYEFEASLESVSRSIEEYNSFIDKAKYYENEAAEVNVQLSAFEVLSGVGNLDKLEASRGEVEATFSRLNSERERLETEVLSLKEKQKSEYIAVDKVNELLTIVFGSGGLRLEPIDGGYVVKNRAKDVLPSRLSTGERNILALCYFLVSVADGKKFDSSYLSGKFLIIDDPISSFDNENKYGTIALMGWLAEMCKAGSPSSRVVILTHDLSVAYDISKIFKLVVPKHQDWVLSGGSLRPANFSGTDAYYEILKKMYQYSILENGDEKPSSNDVRRVWEAFATFELGENPTNATDSKKVFDYLNESKTSAAQLLRYSSLRTFLNADSHSALNVRNFDYYLAPTLSKDGYARFVRDVLLAMHAISPLHVVSRLGAKQEEAAEVRAHLDEALSSATKGFPAVH